MPLVVRIGVTVSGTATSLALSTYLIWLSTPLGTTTQVLVKAPLGAKVEIVVAKKNEIIEAKRYDEST